MLKKTGGNSWGKIFVIYVVIELSIYFEKQLLKLNCNFPQFMSDVYSAAHEFPPASSFNM